MSERVAALVVVAGLALGGCALLPPNPEARTCASSCVDRKNGCLVGATTAEAVARCDAGHQACMQPCLAKPRYLTP